jgi:anthranilate synthase component I
MLATEISATIDVDTQTRLLDGITPVAAYDVLRHALPGPAFLLESAPAPDECARYSVVGLGSVGDLIARERCIRVRTPRRDDTFAAGALLAACRRLMADCAPRTPGRFLGAYGAAAFELASYFEELRMPPPGTRDVPDLHLVVPLIVVVFDHFTHLVSASVLGAEQASAPSAGDVMRLLRAARLDDVCLQPSTECARPGAASDFLRSVARAQDAIAEGEAFQIVLSQEWLIANASDPFAVYRSLRSINPSPYMYHLDFGGGELFGSSPEALCRLDRGRARIRPLAGTRPRPHDPVEERKVAAELQRDPKERAEHVMLVDLARNDLGRVCEYGSIDVADLFTVERYSHVLHLASEVHGTLRAGQDAFDLFAAAFPAGTVSGAPKIRAMQIIAELEGSRRGLYGGSVVYFGFDGSLDACITLRSAFVRDGLFSVRAGAGIVADSIPEREDAECRAKAGAVMAALAAPQRERAS